MGDKTKIEWADATWGPVTGCTKVSPGCDHCYAETLAERFRGTPGHYFEDGFDVVLRPHQLDQPLRWTKPRRIFVNSMSDLFHASVPDEYIAKVWAVMALAPQHTFQVLTKRHGRMRSLLTSDRFRDDFQRAMAGYGVPLLDSVVPSWLPLPNVWLGVSVEDQAAAVRRVPALMETPAALRFLSLEPLLGPVDLQDIDGVDVLDAVDSRMGEGGEEWLPVPRIDWVIVGGESGRGARPMHPRWAATIRDQCKAAGVPFLFKQAGAVLAREWGCTGKGGDPAEWPETFPREYPR